MQRFVLAYYNSGVSRQDERISNETAYWPPLCINERVECTANKSGNIKYPFLLSL
jgi:hypothetical protein